jgi:MerR family transcriptional regulator/heat shock protein HspR
MNRDSSVSVYVISVAAELAGMHPQTLRNYEREGLLTPRRTGGGNRLYSDDDLQLLARIAEMVEEGLNIAGIRRVLQLEVENTRLKAQVATLRRRLGT